MGKRGNNEGSLFQRKTDGRWVAVVTWPDGTRKAAYTKTRAEAAKKLTALSAQRDAGLPAVVERKTVEAFVKEWLARRKSKLRPRTHLRYEQLLRRHVLPEIGHVSIARLTPQQLQAVYMKMEDGGSAAATVRQAHAVVHSVLRQATKWSVTARNVADVVDAPKVEATNITPLTPDEIGQLLDAAQGDRLEALYVIAVTCGLRLGEILALVWTAIDLDAATLTVHGTLQPIGGKLVVAPTKTASSRRQVPLSALAVDALRRHRVRQAEERLKVGAAWAHPEAVFVSEAGALIDGRSIRYRFEPLLERAGLRRITFHTLRHSCATFMLSRGVAMKVVQSLLGHSQIGVTMNTYSHYLPAMGVAAAAEIDAGLGARRQQR